MMHAAEQPLATRLLLNVGHAIDHMFLLIFATAVTSIAREFGLSRWEDLMPYATLTFLLFGLGAWPAGQLGDRWGRRAMMLCFFFGMGASALLISLTGSPLQLAGALALLGIFASIYHPVGIPMLVQGARRPGWLLGVNGFAGNLGVAVSAALTGYLVQHFGWRIAFAVPGIVCLLCGMCFARVVEAIPAARRAAGSAREPVSATLLARVFLVMTLAATSANLLFNFATNGNYELLAERLAQLSRNPATLGGLLAAVYALASLAQLAVGRLIDRCALKPLYLGVLALQIPALALAAKADGWWFYLAQAVFMMSIFGAIPFTDALIVRHVHDSMRSRVAGLRLAISLGASSFAVWLLGPLVKHAGFATLLWLMAAIALLTFLIVSLLPDATPSLSHQDPR